MKARQITTTHEYGKKYDHVFKYYANALEFRSRIRAKNIKNRHKYYMCKVKTSPIKEIEVADDYRKKDFGGGESFKLTNDGFKYEGYRKHSESEYLYSALYFLRSQIRDEFSVEERQKNEDVKFLESDLSRFLNNTGIPKKERDKVARETFLSCRKTLKKLGKEWLIQERDRGMYEDDFNEYCARMEAMQKELNSML